MLRIHLSKHGIAPHRTKLLRCTSIDSANNLEPGTRMSIWRAKSSQICLSVLMYRAHHAAANRLGLPHTLYALDPPTVGPSKWAKAEYATRLLISCINIRSGWGKCLTIFWQGKANRRVLSQIQHPSTCLGTPCVQVCSQLEAYIPNILMHCTDPIRWLSTHQSEHYFVRADCGELFCSFCCLGGE